MPLRQRLLAEALGTAFLLMAVVGSGIMAERLAQGNVALALFANAVATGTALLTLILSFGAISGAHFNPLVSLMAWRLGALSGGDAVAYIGVQMLAAIAGVLATHLMFDIQLISATAQLRHGWAQGWSELVASFGLLMVIQGSSRGPAWAPSFAVAAYITAAYWFTASTSFANPAVTAARAFTGTFSGIRFADVPGFVLAQLLGLLLALLVLPRVFAAPAVAADARG
jgi:glycerol uptake facilitator-like aquaporin